MSATVQQTATPPLPIPDPAALTPAQTSILSALADAIVPSFVSDSSLASSNRMLQVPLRNNLYNDAASELRRLAGDDASDDLIAAYLAESATAQPEFAKGLLTTLATQLSDSARSNLLIVLNVLSTRAGSLLLTGYATPIDALPLEDRERIVVSWANSRIPALRGLHRSLTTLVRLFWLRSSPTIGHLLSYPLAAVNATPAGAGFPFTFLQIPPSPTPEPEIIDTDVLIVGSGCGGAVVAKTLAEAGLKVLVVDKSYYWPPEYLPMTETAAGTYLFGNGGAFSSEDSSMTVVAGSTWGGGGTVNWSASLQPQGMVRREWAEKFGLTHFAGPEFQADLDAVCERMGVSLTAVRHNKANLDLMEGARRLGWSAKPVAQNTGGEEHSDGYCTRGCRDCGKKGPTVTFLPDAAKAGATFIEGLDVKEILFSDSSKKRAVGVKAIWSSRDSHGGVFGPDRTVRDVVIRASRTIVSGGSVYSPVLLLRSGLSNRHIGRHLHLHPVTVAAAVWDDDVRPWEGPILTSVVSEFENVDGAGYGVKLEATTMIPASFLPLFPWRGALESKRFALAMRRMTGYIILARDRYGGRILASKSSSSGPQAEVAYTPSKHDKRHLLDGVIRLATLLYVQGAREIHTAIPGFDPYIRPTEAENDGFSAWSERLRAYGFPDPDCGFASAHQMGSCRMSAHQQDGVVDPKGKVWGTHGLYVADASVFPSASGVNPMITTMGIARGIARGIVTEEFGGKERARL